MGPSLRRSCSACAKYKHSCDLKTPRCSRCVKRNVQCVYTNQPSTARLSGIGPLKQKQDPQVYDTGSLETIFGELDPFEAYPPTRLARTHVQRLIHSFLHKIAFQYYPLDLNATSNPFLVSWWPLALGDPALFHVSLQTACLDEELLARKGFHASEILMADSVALLRRKVLDATLAVQDGTMNSVITLAAIEFGKGNSEVSLMHVEGVKELVSMRGGINAVRQTSPLTARMVSWVSLLVTGQPQFQTQNDAGVGDGIPLVPEWQTDILPIDDPYLLELIALTTDSEVRNTLIRLQSAFNRTADQPVSSTRLHDLTCFVIHRLLSSTPNPLTATDSLTEGLRYAIILFMFIIHGTTYYSHDVLIGSIIKRLINSLTRLDPQPQRHESLDVWMIAVGLVASSNTPHYQWFTDKAHYLACSLHLTTCENVLAHIRATLWTEMPGGEDLFRSHWDSVLASPGLSRSEV